MIPLLVIFGLLAVALVVSLVEPVVKRRRHGPASAELHRDWWSSFERDFRAYAADCERTRRGGRSRQPDHRPDWRPPAR